MQNKRYRTLEFIWLCWKFSFK